MTVASITYRGVNFDVEGSYIAETPSTYFVQGDPSEFIIEDIFIGETSFTHLLTAHHEQIAIAACEWCDTHPAELRKQAMEAF